MARLGKNNVDWEGMSLHDQSRYIKIRRVLEDELDDNLVNMGDEELEYDFMDVVNERSGHMFSGEASSELKKWISGMLSLLTEREAVVIEKRFLMEHTLDEVGKMFNLTNESIRRIENKAIRKLRWGDSRFNRGILKGLWEEIIF